MNTKDEIEIDVVIKFRDSNIHAVSKPANTPTAFIAFATMLVNLLTVEGLPSILIAPLIYLGGKSVIEYAKEIEQDKNHASVKIGLLAKTLLDHGACEVSINQDT